MDFHHSTSLTVYLLSILGYCAGQDALPSGPVNGTLGGNVIFKTTINPTTLFAISWTFGEPPVSVVDFVSSAGSVIGVGYVGRISLDNSTGSLELRKLTLIDSGTYRVSLRTADVIQVGSTSLIVYETISNVTLRANVIDLMELNDTVIFSCSVSSGSSPFSYRWLNGSSEVTARYGIQLGDGGRTLTIANVTRYDQGPYRCIVSNPVSSKPSQNLTLIISYGPENTTMKVTPLDVLYGSGSNLTLSCSAESSPSAQFQWLLNGTLLSNNGPELRLENIQANQSGSYSCWAHNTRTLRYQISEPSDITVLEPISGANITTTPNSSIIEGGSVNLTCDASGAIITREWMKDGHPLSAGGNIIISEDKRVLSINPVKRTDSGEYRCRVSNPISTANAKHGLIVNYGPDGMEIMGPSEIEVGQKITLTCSADSIPTSSYTWVLNGTEIPGHSPEFTKEKSEYSDSGDYTCTATNNVTGNKTSVVHKLSVKTEGSLSQGLSAGAIAGIVIGVLLVLGVAVGVAVYFMKIKGFFKKESSRSVGNTGKSSANGGGPGGNQDLNYADITQFQKRDGGSVQLGNLGTSSTEYAQVRVNNRPGQPAEPPTYKSHHS
ncbi:carcinoembryonic antigen-related cell adhesion molecule 5-like isoform X5 [Salvelinus namaycush]|uniref:Carcinoembryonic antigen-related cell adhesion molecule 5-like isoform X4 n=1 Tax=Salvelinus namaycush TaxID=8040 RepID=A0A8U0UFD4_SALNM|nr:carcinoembryonic antigen-related cell adhesion molecule 5-like isoform X4 [Salvelinus namaycush]XP_038850716.1 carcinoembryonic antigen-related cell adhesion molecule 5-like isoform X5 [Salvelinus namaycush]